MNRLDNAKRAQIVSALVEGNSIRSTSRMTGIARNTITKLLVELGSVCSHYLDETLVNLPCQRIQCDEIWSYVGAKQKNVTLERAEREICGDVWTWVAIRVNRRMCIRISSRPTSEKSCGCRDGSVRPSSDWSAPCQLPENSN